MRFVIVTGVSGAGKTSALKMLEDAKYFCVDNLPIPLLEKFASLMPEIHGEDVQNVALGIDARSGRSLDELEIVLDRMKKAGYGFWMRRTVFWSNVIKKPAEVILLQWGEEWMMESEWKERRCVF